MIYYGIGPSYEVYRSSSVRVAPVVDLAGWHVLGRFQPPSGSDSPLGGSDIVNLRFGARVLFNDRGSIYVGYGHALTTDSWYKNILRFEYRMALGR